MTLPEPPVPLSLTITNLTAVIDDKCHVKNVSFHVPEGGALAITGPVDSGKSALLWAINGLLSEVPGAEVTGTVQINQTEVRHTPLKELRQRVGLLITAPLARTPFAEVALPLQGNLARETGDRVEHALRLVGLWRELRDRLHQPYNTSNPVLLRLLTLARTMILRPGLLLLDDPTRGLDSMGRARFEDSVSSVLATGHTTLVWATREPDQAGRVANSVAFLCDGEIVEMGPADHLFERPVDARTECFLTGDYNKLLSLRQKTGQLVKDGACR